MGIKLLALDLDGTMLDRQSRLPEANRAAAAEAMARGIEVILVTGRSWLGARRYYEELGLTGPSILYLGALTVADRSGRIQHHRPLVAEAWERLRAFALVEGLPVTACAGTDQAVADGELPPHDLVAADTAYATCRADDFVGWDEWNPYSVIAPDLAPCKAPPIMLAVYGRRAAMRVMEAFPQGLPASQFDLTDKLEGETVLHIWHRDVDKGWALDRFCRERGYQPDEVAALGDAPMDLSMIRYAGVGVAMPDGHPVLQQHADWVLTPAEAIRRILQKQR